MTRHHVKTVAEGLAKLYQQACHLCAGLAFESMTPAQLGGYRKVADLDSAMIPARWLLDGATLTQHGTTWREDGTVEVRFVFGPEPADGIPCGISDQKPGEA